MLPNFEKLDPQGIATIKAVMVLSGLIFMSVSAYMIVDPSGFESITYMNKDISQLVAWPFLIVGALDILIALILFRRKERK